MPTPSRSRPARPGTGDLEAIGEIITDKKIVIGVIDHHTLQIERPDQIAALIREALKHIPPERLIISSDCGMGREGMSRRHAHYKMVAMVLGTNVARGTRPAGSPVPRRRPALLAGTLMARSWPISSARALFLSYG